MAHTDRSLQIRLAPVVALMSTATYFIKNIEIGSSCISSDVCVMTLVLLRTIAESIFTYSLFVLPITIWMVFLRKETFRVWLKVSKFLVPISFFLIFITPRYSTQSMIFTFSDRLYVTIALGTLFVLVSIITVLVVTLRSRKAR